MLEKWIGEEDNTGGSYYPIKKELCPELCARHGGHLNAKKLYKFNSRFGQRYNITDEDVINHIDKLIIKDDSLELHEYLYALIIQKFGAIEFIKQVEHKIHEQREIGYGEGKIYMQKAMRELMGLNSF